MSNAELQNSIIQKILQVTDKQLLDYLDSLLKKNNETPPYVLSQWELKMLKESFTDYEMVMFWTARKFSKETMNG